jgi:orotidine-5'-phosphate decarboxylase
MIDSNKIIVSLDSITREEALRIAESLKGRVWGFKLNDLLYDPSLRLDDFLRYGKVFADVKLHDIPNTVRNSVARLADEGVDIITVHARGGHAMMEAAKEASGGTTVLGVTVLTSEPGDVTHEVVALAKAALDANLDGVVSSGRELRVLREAYPGALLVVPGIRPRSYVASDDQSRTVTPQEAIDGGADYLVIGRPIVEAENALIALDTICRE